MTKKLIRKLTAKVVRRAGETKLLELGTYPLALITLL